MNKKRLLLTGSAGFIFSNFVRNVVYEKLPYELVSIDKIASSSIMNNIYQGKSHEFYLADICDQHIIDRIFEYVKPEIVIHGAAESAVDKSINDPNIFIKSNVMGTQTMINMALKYGVKKFVYISTDEVYGALPSEEGEAWTEEAPLNPKNPYSASKAAGEMLVRAAANTHGLPFMITRSCNNYGPRQTHEKLVPRAIKCLLEGKKIPVYGEGKQIRDWMHTYDKSSAIIRLLDKGEVGETYNISANQEMSNIEVIKKICQVMGKDPAQHIEFVAERPGHDFRYSVNSTKLRNLGWAPVYKFENGIEKTITWFVENSWFLR